MLVSKDKIELDLFKFFLLYISRFIIPREIHVHLCLNVGSLCSEQKPEQCVLQV